MLRKVVSFLGTLVGSWVLFASSALANEVAAGGDGEWTFKKYVAAMAGLTIAIGAFGGAMAQGKAVTATMEGIARNPGASGKMFVPMILGLALIESLVIYCLVIAFALIGKLA